jgi:hypothetical protein
VGLYVAAHDAGTVLTAILTYHVAGARHTPADPAVGTFPGTATIGAGGARLLAERGGKLTDWTYGRSSHDLCYCVRHPLGGDHASSPVGWSGSGISWRWYCC